MQVNTDQGPLQYKYQRPKLYRKQFHALFNKARYAVVEASTKSGKTHGCLVWLLEQALKGKPGNQFWWIAPSRKQARIAYSRMKGGLPSSVYHSNETDLTITLANGSVVSFMTGENPDLLYGEDVYAAVVDEASRCREDSWFALRSTLTATSGPVRIIGNVKGRKNWAYRLARRAEAYMRDNPSPPEQPLYHFARLTALDAIEAGIFNEDELEDARQQMPEEFFRELYYAEPAADEGNPFGPEDIAACTIDGLAEGYPICWGWDLAKSVDWTVGIALNSDGQVCAFHRFRDSWQQTMDRILRYTGKTYALVDATGVGDPILEELRHRGGPNFDPFRFTRQSKQQLMEGLAVAIQEHAIGFPDNEIAQEISAFEYSYSNDGRHVFYEAPSGQHDDCVMALALAWRAYATSVRKKPIRLVSAHGGGQKEGWAL